MSEAISIQVVSTSGGPRVTVSISPDATVLEFKHELHKLTDVPLEEQRLIYRGRILKDEDTLQSYGVADECVFHLARKRQTATPATQPVASPPPVPPSTPQANPLPEGLNGIQEAVLNSVLNNPEVLQTFMRNNPTFQQLLDQNPELAHAMNNPELIRESLRLLNNPNLMQEHMRNVDRAMSNLESIPGGFNALRQIYENVQEPLLNSAQNRSPDNPFSALFNQPQSNAPRAANPPTSGAINTEPLPNPWAPVTSAPPSGQAGETGTGDPFAALAGGALPGNLTPEQMREMMQDPSVQQMTQSLLSSPGVMEQMADSLPGMREMMNSPGAREVFSNPETIRNMMNPENLQAMRQLLQSVQTLQRGGLGPLLNLPQGGDVASLLGGMTGSQPVADPETAYANQLQQLQEMGFFDRDANIRALQATGGNVSAAVERLLSQL